MDNICDDNNVDVFLQKIKEKQEIEDYINNGKYPDRLKTNFIKKHFPKMEETVIYEPIKLQNNETDNLNNNIDNISAIIHASPHQCCPTVVERSIHISTGIY